MFHWFDASLVPIIDALTWKHGCKRHTKGKLGQLAGLFGKRYLSELHSTLSRALPASPGSSAVLSLKLAWIDKIPVAEAKDILGRRTELGDAIIFAIEGDANSIAAGNLKARAVILRAEVARDDVQLAQPTVPIAKLTPGSSTDRELKLLSGWPAFNLLKTANSKEAAAKGIALANGRPPYPFGWYLAAPRVSKASPIIGTVWPSWWMGGVAIRGAPCDASFGTLLRRLVTGSSVAGLPEVGAPFSCSEYPPPRTGTGWDRVCAEVISIVEEGDAPKHIFGGGIGKMAHLKDIPIDFLLAGSTAPQIAYSERPDPSSPQAAWLGFCLEPFFKSEQMRSRDPLRICRRRIPVLIVHSLIGERSAEAP